MNPYLTSVFYIKSLYDFYGTKPKNLCHLNVSSPIINPMIISILVSIYEMDHSIANV